MAEETDPEAEQLLIVGAGLGKGEAEIEGDRNRTHHGNGDAHADADRSTVILDIDGRLHGAGVEKADEIDLVVGLDGDLIFQAVKPHEIAADFEAIDVRANAAELKTPHPTETAP